MELRVTYGTSEPTRNATLMNDGICRRQGGYYASCMGLIGLLYIPFDW